MSGNRELRIRVPVLTRVEGEGSLRIDIAEGRIEGLQLSIFEPPRLFEKLVEGQAYDALPDILARICGICPVAYQVTVAQALEQLFACRLGPEEQALRRAMYCGEWLQSHSLHIHLLALPDFLGFDSAIAMAERYPDQLRRGLRLQELGNRLIELLGGRSVHPVGLRVGGFHRLPEPGAVDTLAASLEAAAKDAEALFQWCAGLDYPTDHQVFTSVALSHPEDYAIEAGTIISGGGLHLDISDYEDWFEQFQLPHSTALYSHLDEQPYLVGPLARINLNLHQLPEPVRLALNDSPIRFPSHNMFHSLLARAAEVWFAVIEAARLLRQYRPPERPAEPLAPRPGIAFGATEAPRGLLWQRIRIGEKGRVRQARIVPPTSQNQARIEADLEHSLQALGLDRPEPELRLRAERVVRNYDPCISCATHFLGLEVNRR